MINNNILKAWVAGFVRRWHSNIHLVDTTDYDSGHQQRCTIMLLLFWPDASRASIIDTLTHDQGEVDAGDVSHPTKRKHPPLREILQLIEDESIRGQGFPVGEVDELELARRKFLDLLDSYVWMLRHKPQLRAKVEWEEQREQLQKQACDLGVYNRLNELLEDATTFFS